MAPFFGIRGRIGTNRKSGPYATHERRDQAPRPSAMPARYADTTGPITLPATSVNRKSRPFKLKVNRL